MIQTKHFGTNKIKKRHKKTEVCWCFKCYSFFLLLLWTQNFHFYYHWICRKMYFWNIICCVQPPGITSALWNITFVNVDYCFLSLDISTWPPARWTWWRGMEGRCWWACSVHAYNAVGGAHKKMGHCLSAASLTAVHLRTSLLLYTLVS